MEKLSFDNFYTIVWSLVPAVWREADDEYGKSLQILLYTMSQHMYYYFYNKVVHMEELFDPDRCPEKYLKFLAGMVGWKLVGVDSASWREQIKAAPLLYKLRGTQRGVLLAEKLIGYSIFMSELYRDHIGDAVPKERIFNNTPDTIKLKPWFRKTLTSLEGELLPGYAESDQFESFNASRFVKLNSQGVVLRPRVLAGNKKLYFSKLSTSAKYNNATGAYSTARYAKLPRINVVLKYDNDLDSENLDGSTKQNNFSSALDLLMQFKPFHVYIEGLEVRYSLSEYIFEPFNMSSETLNVHEQTNFAARMEFPRAEHTISFSPEDATEISVEADSTPVNDNKGIISSIHRTIELSTVDPVIETSLWEITKKSLTLKARKASSPLVTLTFDNSAKTVTRNIGSFITEGYVDGDIIGCEGTFYNDGPYIIATGGVTALTLTLTTAPVTRTAPLSIIYNKKTVALAAVNGVLLTVSDFYTPVPFEPLKFPYTLLGDHGQDYSIDTTVAMAGHALLKYDISRFIPEAVLDFKTMLSSQYYATTEVTSTTAGFHWTPEASPRFLSDLNAYWAANFTSDELAILFGSSKTKPMESRIGIPTSNITAVTASDSPFRSSISVTIPEYTDPSTGLTVVSHSETQSIASSPSRPWDLKGLKYAQSSFLFGMGFTDLQVIQKLYNDRMIIVLDTIVSSVQVYYLLTPGSDYYFDNTGELILNSLSIAAHFTHVPSDYTFLSSCNLQVLFLNRETAKDETRLAIQSRGFRYKVRKNSKFSRQFLINSLPPEAISRLMATDIVSVDGKTKLKTTLGTKKFKETPVMYTRSSLKNEVIDNYVVVAKDPLNRIDKAKWEVYSPEVTNYYLRDQKITNNWWGNFYEVKLPGNARVPYSNVDVSAEGQAAHAVSDQWLSTISYINVDNPDHFLTTRKSDSTRAGIWKRNSTKFVSIPFIRGRRDTLQVFRRDIPTFTRSEESTDYLVDTSAPPRIDNYKYILPDKTDVSFSYFDPGFTDTARVSVTTDSIEGEKVKFTSPYSPSQYTLVLPVIEDSYYDTGTSLINTSDYFSPEYKAKSTLYAGNIPVSRNPSTHIGVTENTDRLNFLITDLELIVDNFLGLDGVEKDPDEWTFILSKPELVVTWNEANTGENIAFGYVIPVGIETIPSVKVYLNGILLSHQVYIGDVLYPNQWRLSLGKTKAVVLTTPVIDSDVIRVEYEVMPGTLDTPQSPVGVQIPQTIESTLSSNDIASIVAGNRYMIALPTDSTTPYISWYDNVTNNYINSSSEPIKYQPFDYYETAQPDMTLKINGIDYDYKRFWLIAIKLVGTTKVGVVAIAPEITLSAGDVVRLDYFSTV